MTAPPANGSANRPAAYQRILAYLLIVFIAALAVYRRDELWHTFQTVDLGWAGVGLGSYYVNYLFRALRLAYLANGAIRIWPDAIRIVGLHGISTYLMPMRSGEISLPLLLHAHWRLSFQEGLQILFKARLLDIATLGGWILMSAVFVSDRVNPPIKLVWVATGVLMVLAPAGLKVLGGWLTSSRFTLLQRIGAGASIANFSPSQVIASMFIWLFVGGVIFCAVKAVGLSLNPSETFFLITIQLPLQLIPIQGIANAGNHEGGWVLALVLLGIPSSVGLNSALASHALLLAYVLLLAPMVFIAARFKTAA